MRTPLILALAALTAGGCADGDDLAAGARVTIDTIDGVPHVISDNQGAWERGDPWRVPADSGLIIGQAEGPEVYSFGRISGLTVGEDRRIYVGDTQALEVRVFSPDGTFQTRFGREGAGPGEFTNISGLGRAPDGIAVLDGDQGRVSVFSPDGEFLRSFRIRRPYRIYEQFAVMGFDGEGRFFDRARLSAAPGVDSMGVIVFSPDDEVTDTILVAVIEEDPLVVERDGVRIMSFPRPLAPRPSLAIGPGGGIHFARGDEYRVVVLSPEGDTLRVLRRELQPRPVSAGERDSAMAMIDDLYQQAAGTTAPRGIELPSVRPLIGTLRVDRAGNLWVGAAADPGSQRLEWSVHDPEGRYLGAVATPVMAVAEIGEDYLAGVFRDELGVERVGVYPLAK